MWGGGLKIPGKSTPPSPSFHAHPRRIGGGPEPSCACRTGAFERRRRTREKENQEKKKNLSTRAYAKPPGRRLRRRCQQAGTQCSLRCWCHLGLGISELEFDPLRLTVEKKSTSRGYTRLPWLVKSASFEDSSTPPLAIPIGCSSHLTFQDPFPFCSCAFFFFFFLLQEAAAWQEVCRLAAQTKQFFPGGRPRLLGKWTRLTHDGGAMHRKDVVPSNTYCSHGWARSNPG